MRYFVTLDGRTFEIEVDGDSLTVDGEPVDAGLETVAGGAVRSLLVDGRSVALVARKGETRGFWQVTVDGVPREAEVVDERTREMRALTGAAAGHRGPRPVRAPMPGLVVRVEVEVGDVVKAGQGVAIVEAMKMENELKAESAGRVVRIAVEAGQPVEKGTVLVEFEAE